VGGDDDAERASLRSLLAGGIFTEPTSAAAHAGLALAGDAVGGTTVVALTGHGLKAAGVISEVLPR
jgi:threonine synthase